MYSIPKILVALALITSPDLEIPKNFDVLTDELQSAAKIIQVDSWNFYGEYDLEVMRIRHYELNVRRYVPRAEDLERFIPNEEVCNQNFDLAYKYQLEVDKLVALRVNHKLSFVYDICTIRYNIWSNISYAANKSYPSGIRREYLAEAMSVMGERDFYSGNIPPPVPLDHVPWYTPVRTPACPELSQPLKKGD